MIDRRRFSLGLATLGLAPTLVHAAGGTNILRGSLDATHFGVRPGAIDDQSRTLQIAIDGAAREGRGLFLPAGHYLVSDIRFPSNCWISGVPGGTRLIYTGIGPLAQSKATDRVILEGLVFDGANRPIPGEIPALVHFSTVSRAEIRRCEFVGSSKNGATLDRMSGHITGNRISGAALAGLHVNDSSDLTISDNTVTECGNNGILVWRFSQGEDGTIVSRNHISKIYSHDGGTGQNGNGINIFRAGSVIVSDNRITDCDFSAIRGNAASNLQVTSNSCARLGEVAIYSEFGFEGSVISSNLIDDAATGIAITNFSSGGRLAVCQGNLVRNMRQTSLKPTDTPSYGVGIGAEADTAITGNVVEGAPHAGIGIGWGPYLRDVTATGNIVRHAGVGIMVSVAPGAGSAVITDNVISETKRGAIRGMKWMEMATKDLAVSGAKNHPQLIIERNRVG